GEVLRADGQRDLRVRVVVRDGRRLLGARRGRRRGRAAAAPVVAAAAGSRAEGEGEQRGERRNGASRAHGVGAILLLGMESSRRRDAACPVTFNPAGVSRRCSAESPTSAATASTATVMAPPNWPASP